jgi:ligand-binding sensor domain-containing protein
VYGASPYGVVVYDQLRQRWASPLTIEDGFPRADLPVALEVDELAGTLWMLTRTGALWAHDVALGDEWRWIGTLPGAPPARLVSYDGALWIRTNAGWFQSSAAGGAPASANPPPDVRDASASGLEQLERQSAGFRSAGSSLTVDEYLRRFEITSATPSSDPSRWWLGTWGGGVYSYNDRLLNAEALPFGSIGRGVSAIAEALSDGGYWFGSDGLDARRGVAHADRELQRWNWHESGRVGGAPAGPVHAILETPMGVWVAGQDGLYRLIGDRWARLTDGDALPSTSVRSLAWAAGAVWAGTDRGLARITAGAEAAAVAVTRIDGTSGTRINALVQQDSLLWIASDRGLWHLNLATGALAQPPLDDARLRGRVLGIAYDRPHLYSLAESSLLVYDGASWSAPPLAASIVGIGRPTHLAVRNGIVWIAGSAGALGFDPASGAETLLSVPRDIPEGPVRQVLPTADGVWFATPAGALLIRVQ